MTSIYYEVDKILKKRTQKGKVEYLVKWKKYPESQATWEETKNIPKKIVTDFESVPRPKTPKSKTGKEKNLEETPKTLGKRKTTKKIEDIVETPKRSTKAGKTTKKAKEKEDQPVETPSRSKRTKTIKKEEETPKVKVTPSKRKTAIKEPKTSGREQKKKKIEKIGGEGLSQVTDEIVAEPQNQKQNYKEEFERLEIEAEMEIERQKSFKDINVITEVPKPKILPPSPARGMGKRMEEHLQIKKEEKVIPTPVKEKEKKTLKINKTKTPQPKSKLNKKRQKIEIKLNKILTPIKNNIISPVKEMIRTSPVKLKELFKKEKEKELLKPIEELAFPITKSMLNNKLFVTSSLVSLTLTSLVLFVILLKSRVIEPLTIARNLPIRFQKFFYDMNNISSFFLILLSMICYFFGTMAIRQWLASSTFRFMHFLKSPSQFPTAYFVASVIIEFFHYGMILIAVIIMLVKIDNHLDLFVYTCLFSTIGYLLHHIFICFTFDSRLVLLQKLVECLLWMLALRIPGLTYLYIGILALRSLENICKFTIIVFKPKCEWIYSIYFILKFLPLGIALIYIFVFITYGYWEAWLVIASMIGLGSSSFIIKIKI